MARRQRKSPNREYSGNVSDGPLVSSGACDGDPAFGTPSPLEVEGGKPWNAAGGPGLGSLKSFSDLASQRAEGSATVAPTF